MHLYAELYNLPPYFFKYKQTSMNPIRIGYGYDTHRMVEGRKLILGGIDIAYEKGLLGHSDADVLLHAICDALLGALNCSKWYGIYIKR